MHTSHDLTLLLASRQIPAVDGTSSIFSDGVSHEHELPMVLLRDTCGMPLSTLAVAAATLYLQAVLVAWVWQQDACQRCSLHNWIGMSKALMHLCRPAHIHSMSHTDMLVCWLLVSVQQMTL